MHAVFLEYVSISYVPSKNSAKPKASYLKFLRTSKLNGLTRAAIIGYGYLYRLRQIDLRFAYKIDKTNRKPHCNCICYLSNFSRLNQGLAV